MDAKPLPHRRGMLVVLAAAPLSLPTLGASAADAVRSPLSKLIEAHRRAAAAHLSAIYAEEGVDRSASGELLTIALRNGNMHVEPDKISRAVIEKQVRDSYERARILAEGAHRLIRDESLFAAQCRAADAAEAADFASITAAYEAYEARPARRDVAEAADRRARASDEEDAAMLALCSYRCKTIEEAGQRAVYLLGPAAWDKDDPLEEHVIALLRSFAPGEQAHV